MPSHTSPKNAKMGPTTPQGAKSSAKRTIKKLLSTRKLSKKDLREFIVSDLSVTMEQNDPTTDEMISVVQGHIAEHNVYFKSLLTENLKACDAFGGFRDEYALEQE